MTGAVAPAAWLPKDEENLVTLKTLAARAKLVLQDPEKRHTEAYRQDLMSQFSRLTESQRSDLIFTNANLFFALARWVGSQEALDA